MIKGEEGFITAILTQAVEDARYVGLNKYMIKQKYESINWIMNNDPQFNYYCKLMFNEKLLIKAREVSKKKAEEKAAKRAYKVMKIKDQI